MQQEDETLPPYMIKGKGVHFDSTFHGTVKELSTLLYLDKAMFLDERASLIDEFNPSALQAYQAVSMVQSTDSVVTPRESHGLFKPSPSTAHVLTPVMKEFSAHRPSFV